MKEYRNGQYISFKDVNLSKPNDILALVDGDGSGRVQR